MIITDFTDQDLYKISMGQAVWRQYPKAEGRYEFCVRTKNPTIPLADIADDIRKEIESLESVVLTNDEYCFIQTAMPWIKQDYLDWLSIYRFNPLVDVDIKTEPNGGVLISPHGKWFHNIFYEVLILAIVEELYCSKISGMDADQAEKKAIDRLKPKMDMLQNYPGLKFTDFATRRRYSKRNHRAVLSYLKRNCPNLVGTSNVLFARELGLKPIGTVAHEFFMAHLALTDRIDQAQKRALHVWLQEYGENLGTALTDTFTSEAFWRDFDKVLANSFSGIRQDSGDPFKFGWDAIRRYWELGIDPMTKFVIFSDSLDFPKMIHLFETFNGQIQVGFGIGTNLGNDVGIEPLSIVMKLMELNGVPLVKLSDSDGKVMGDASMVKSVREAYGVKSCV